MEMVDRTTFILKQSAKAFQKVQEARGFETKLRQTRPKITRIGKLKIKNIDRFEVVSVKPKKKQPFFIKKKKFFK